MPTTVLVPLMALVVCVCSRVCEGTPVPTVFDEVLSLYTAGKVDEARKRVNDYVEYYLAESEKGTMATSREAQTGLSVVGAAAGVLAVAFQNEKEAPLPDALLELSARVRSAVDQTLERAQKLGCLEERARQTMDFAKTQKGALLVAQILALRDAGESELWLSLAHENLACIEEYLRGKSIETLLCTPRESHSKESVEA